MRSRGAGAIAGQLSQALASFLLQIIAARSLGASGLGVFALLYSAIILGTGIVSGFVGDSLTVLDRGDRRIRAALQNWCLLLSACAGLLGAIGAAASGLVGWVPAVIFGLAACVFMLEDTLRRLLMASMKFWALPAVDITGLVAALVVLVLARLLTGGLSITYLLIGLLAAQVVSSVVAVLMLPGQERRVASPRPAEMVAVLRYGQWRSGHRAVRSLVLTVTRSLVTVAVGTALYGQLEAARIYMAPALLMVTGLTSYLLPMYAARRKRSVRQSIGQADLFAGVLLAGTLLVGAVAVVLIPRFGPLVTGHHFHIETLAVVGWAAYAAATATVMPYGSLAAVRAAQSRLFAFRLLDSTLSVVFAALLIFVLQTSASWVPFGLAAGTMIGGLLVRWAVLVPLRRTETSGVHAAAT